VLLEEDKTNLKIIITPYTLVRKEIKNYIKKMGLYENVFPSKVIGCPYLFNNIIFGAELSFCCEGMNFFNNLGYPRLPYLDTSKKTIIDFLNKKEIILDELNGLIDLNFAKSCIKCKRLYTRNLTTNNCNDKITWIKVGPRPSVCQAKCIYCSEHEKPSSTHEIASLSHHPKMVAEMIDYLRSKDYIDEKCFMAVSPGEITITPHKDLMLDAISKYKGEFATNAFLFDIKIANSMKKNASVVYVSLDCGTRDTFKIVKGLDKFDRVIENIKKYREHGDLRLKYIIMPGINDYEQDFNGIISILKMLNLNNLTIAFEFGLPLRASLRSTAELILKLTENEMTFDYFSYYNVSQVKDFIKKYYTEATEDMKNAFIKRHNELKMKYVNEYAGNYGEYKKFLFYTEIYDLIGLFKKETRFALLGFTKDDKYLIWAFKKMGIPLIEADASYKESYGKLKNVADIFIIRNKSSFHDVKSYIESVGGDGKRLLDIETYYFSFEPASLFLKQNIDEKYLLNDNRGGNVMQNEYKDTKIVLFGAGKNGKNMFEQLLKSGIEPAYFVDNNQSLYEKKQGHIDILGKTIPIHAPEKLMNEQKEKLQIIITPAETIKKEIKAQLMAMGFLNCISEMNETKKEMYVFKQKDLSDTEVVPSQHIMQYKSSAESHLKSGMNDYKTIMSILNNNGFDFTQDVKVYDFGCADCRVLRHFISDSTNTNLWGSDIQVEQIKFGIENFAKLNLFANNIEPPLPIKDNFFDFVYALSIFTHLTDYHTAWIAELGRIVKPEGYMYLTFLDENFAAHFMEQVKNGKVTHNTSAGASLLRIFDDVKLFNHIYTFDFDFLSTNYYQGNQGQVFMHSDYIKRITAPFFDIVEVIPRAYGNIQTGYLFKHK